MVHLIFLQMFSLFVVPPGLEPGLFGTKNQRVANYTIGHCIFWVEDGFRSHYLRYHKPTLSRLSYNHHISSYVSCPERGFTGPNISVIPVGLEPTTPSLKVRCSKPTELRDRLIMHKFDYRTI